VKVGREEIREGKGFRYPGLPGRMEAQYKGTSRINHRYAVCPKYVKRVVRGGRSRLE